MLDQLTYDDFTAYRGKTFELRGHGGRVEITLLDVRLSPFVRGSLVKRQPFAILFAAPRSADLGVSLQTIRHPKRGLMEGVFLTPVLPPAGDVEKTKDFRFYEAIFN